MAAFPTVIDAIVTVATSAIEVEGVVRVVRGRDLSDDPGDVVMVGVRDVTPVDWDTAGTFNQSMQTFGGGREEVGLVYGLIFANDGDADQGAALDAACDHLAALEAAVREDPTLGLTQFDYVVAETQTGDITESQNDSGATAALSFAITYKIRI